MARVLRGWVAWLPAVLLIAACGAGDGPPAEAGISRATPLATERPARTPTAGAATPPSGGASVASDATLAPWAAAVCESTARFDDAVAAVQDGVDPSTLPFAERLARAVMRYGAYRAALVEQTAALGGIAPPPAAAAYHAALRAQVSELDRLFADQIVLLDRVVLASEIDDATAALQVEVDRLENTLALVRSLLPDGARTALATPLRCGEILG